MSKILILDSTLRDGNHAVRHQLNKDQIAVYSAAANTANIPVVIIGHGNGLGAASLQVGESLLTDLEMLQTAREKLTKSKLGVYIIPGFGTINKDLSQAIDAGVDVVSVGSHCTETDTTQRHIEYVRERKKEVYGNLMMTHMASKEVLVEECLKTESYGAQGVILMDSAGAFLPKDVTEKVSALVKALKIPVGFHAHNNLCLSVANSIAAVEAGATIIDGCARGFGAGAGNAPLEVIVPVLEKMGYSTGIDLYKILDSAEIAEEKLMKVIPSTKSTTIVSGLAGVFSGFAKHVERVSLQYGVDPRDVFFELGKRKPVAGQEDLIIEVAMDIAERKRKGRK
ncbi:4-hydroxy-2-oxovalerate aldolase [Candidatus Margulisiibacteriota bacterium]